MSKEMIILLVAGGALVYFMTRPSPLYSTGVGSGFSIGGVGYPAGGYPLTQYRNDTAEIIAATGAGLTGLLGQINN